MTTYYTIQPGQSPGEPSNGAAFAGNQGEYVAGFANPGAIANTTVTNITSISLTPGDWDIWFETKWTPGVTTTVNLLVASIGTTSATLNITADTTGIWNATVEFNAAVLGGGAASDFSVNCGPVRASISGSTVFYGVAFANYGTSTLNVKGLLRARRVR